MSKQNDHVAFCLGDFVYVLSTIKEGKRKKPKQVKNIGYITDKDNSQGCYVVSTVLSAAKKDTIYVEAKNLEYIPVSFIKQSLHETECDTGYDDYLAFVESYNSYRFKQFDLPYPTLPDIQSEQS